MGAAWTRLGAHVEPRLERVRSNQDTVVREVDHAVHRGVMAWPVGPATMAGSKLRVMELVDKLSFEAVDAGPLKNAHLLEPLAMLWIDEAMKRGRGRDFAFALVNMR